MKRKGMGISWAARRLWASAPVLAGALLSVSGQHAAAQSFQDALSAAYQNNPQLLAERAQLRATDESVPQALANWRPTVQLNGSASYNHYSLKPIGFINPAASVNARGDTYGVQITQPLYRGGRTSAQTASALNQVRSERAHLVSIEQSVLLQAVTDYVNVVRDQATLGLNINNEQVLRRQLEYTNDRFNVGEVTRTDVSQAEATLAQAIASRQQAEGTLQADRANYMRDIGVAPGDLQAPTLSPVLPTSRGEAVSMAGSGNPDIVSAQFAQQAAEDDIRAVRGQLLPQVSLNGTLQRLVNPSTFPSRETDATVTAQVTMPLYEGGAIYSQSRQAQQTVSLRKHQVDQARQQSVDTAVSSWEQLQSTRAAIKSFQAQVKANEIALEGVQQEAAVGERTVLDILNAELTLFQSRVSLVQAQHDEIIAKFTLAGAVGQLTARQLSLPVPYYDPDVNFQEVRDKWIGFGTGEVSEPQSSSP